MKRSPGLWLAVLTLTICLPAARATADPVLITHTFDDRSPGVQGYFERDLFLVTLLDLSGSVFSAVNIEASPFALSPPNVVTLGLARGLGVEGHFLFEDRPLINPATRFVRFNVVGMMPGDVPWTFSTFNRHREILASYDGTGAQSGFNARARADIAGFVFTPGSPRHALDDLSFETPIVPEPGTLVLLGSGLAAAAWRRARKPSA